MRDPKPEPAILRRPKRVRYLKLIALFKIVKGLLALALGFSLLFLNSRTHWLDAISDWTADELLLVHSKVVLYLLNKLQAAGLAPGLLALFYSAVLFTEGIGVYLQKRWAEFLMVFATGALIPFEVRHVYHRPSIGGFVILAANCFIVWFLYRVLKREKHHTSRWSWPLSEFQIAARDSKCAKNARSLFHRQTDDVAVRSFDSLDDFHAMTLRGVRACLIERIYFRQIVRDRALVELAEMHSRYFLKTVRLPIRGMANED